MMTSRREEKTKEVKAAADLVRRYLEQYDPEGDIHTKYHKMVLGVGEDEGSRLKERYENYRETFPALEFVDRDRIGELEPTVTEGRDPGTELTALFTPDGYTVDYGKLAESYLERVRESENDDSKTFDRMFNTEVEAIESSKGGGYRLQLAGEATIHARRDYFATLDLNWPTVASLCRILGRPLLFRFAVMNALYEIPYIGKRLFLRQIRRIIPSLRPAEIRRARGYGGVRPQMVDTEARDLDMGEAKIDGENARFNVTPSPGASVCLASAREDARAITEALGRRFDEDRFDRELGEAAEAADASRP